MKSTTLGDGSPGFATQMVEMPALAHDLETAVAPHVREIADAAEHRTASLESELPPFGEHDARAREREHHDFVFPRVERPRAALGEMEDAQARVGPARARRSDDERVLPVPGFARGKEEA